MHISHTVQQTESGLHGHASIHNPSTFIDITLQSADDLTREQDQDHACTCILGYLIRHLKSSKKSPVAPVIGICHTPRNARRQISTRRIIGL